MRDCGQYEVVIAEEAKQYFEGGVPARKETGY